MEIIAQINQEQENKINLIKEKTQQTLNEILNNAIKSYYEKIINTPKNNLEKFREIGFIGCIEGEENLAANSIRI
jgi:vacuolar-type H+-ATPase subunit E/Vma4